MSVKPTTNQLFSLYSVSQILFSTVDPGAEAYDPRLCDGRNTETLKQEREDLCFLSTGSLNNIRTFNCLQRKFLKILIAFLKRHINILICERLMGVRLPHTLYYFIVANICILSYN
jgi:hypothetical protein